MNRVNTLWSEHKSGLFDAELEFTETYIKYRNEPKSLRELECLKVLIPSMLVPIAGKDLIAGRVKYHSVGFHHIMYGKGPSDGIDRVGYCFDKGRALEKLEGANITDEYRKKIDEMFAFWEKENSNYKARQSFSPLVKKTAPSDDWMNYPAVIHPLYRIAEIHPDHKKLVSLGIPGLRKEISDGIKRTEKYGGDPCFYKAMNGALDLVVYVIDYYIKNVDECLSEINEFSRKSELEKMKSTLLNIRCLKPKTFHEAFQLMWIYNVTAGISDFSRMDTVLGDFYANDIHAGILTEKEAVDMLVSLYRIIEDIYNRNSRIIFGGLGRMNEENADKFAMAAMEALSIHRGIHPQLSLRYYEGMNYALMDKALELLGEGLTFPILYNDDINVLAVEKAFNVSREVALDYSFFGCGEFVLGHRSIGTPNAIINMPKVLEITLRNGADAFTNEVIGLQLGHFRDFKTFDDLFAAYEKQTNYFVEASGKIQEEIYISLNNEASFLLQSMLLNDCLSRGKGILDGGIQHLGGTFETYGNTTTADSLMAIKEAVYDKKLFTQDELISILNANFKGYEKERKLLLNIPKYGNDNEKADAMAIKVHEHICNITRDQKDNTLLDSFLVVVINNSANMQLGWHVAATPDGRFSGDILSNANGPTQGMDKKGITALINSITKLKNDIHAGSTQNLKFSKKLFNEERAQLKILLHTFFELGGLQANINVVNKEDLEKAMADPEKYENIIVRVGGYSSKFINLHKSVQEDIIRRTTY